MRSSPRFASLLLSFCAVVASSASAAGDVRVDAGLHLDAPALSGLPAVPGLTAAPLGSAPSLTVGQDSAAPGARPAGVALPSAQGAQFPAAAETVLDAASPEQGARPSAQAQLSQTTLAGDAGAASAFDGMGAFSRALVAPPVTTPRLNKGVRLNARPRPPESGAVRLDRFHLSRDRASRDGTMPRVLDADPNDAGSIETALRALVDSDPRKYGASSADMAKVHVKLVKGDKAQGQADTYYAVFRQWKEGEDVDGSKYYLLVDGGALTFVIKVFDGKPAIMATEGRLYPGVDASIMKPGYSDKELDRIAAQRLQSPPDSLSERFWRWFARMRARISGGGDDDSGPRLLTRQIANVEGRWRAVNIYQASDLEGRPVIVGVDVHSGEAFAWSAQSLLRSESPLFEAAASKLVANGNALSETGGDHGPVQPLPLSFTYGFDRSGKQVVETDANGSFTNATGAALTVTFRLEGRFTPRVIDNHEEQNGPIETTVTVQPGETATVELPVGENPERVAVVNGYVYYTKLVAWLMGPGGIDDERVAKRLAGLIVNKTDQPINAYYNPANDTLNLEAAQTVRSRSGQVIQGENTAQPSIILHEGTHRAVQIFSQLWLSVKQLAAKAFRFVAKIVEPVMDGGVNEAIADTVSMYMRGSPLVGEGFIQNAPKGRPNFIRTGENETQYDPKNPDPHAQGEAYMGFTWKLRKALEQALGEAVGAAYAARLAVPTTLFSQPKDVPTAVMHVVLASMTEDGSIPHLELFRRIAAVHGVEIPDVASPRVAAASGAARAPSDPAAR